ncbi:monocarboxylate transporter 14-like [Pecten maximus]|uniref:monocarboxylate transporter 14-like n=1 Tax=Pecten maximus TaxID=6579 RepID=UPI001457F7FE|nr:monocarboxylate transporter 14-like [Pecten maximus]XP_033758936.1 monocarboxylate transporter 14-like [Pecten maximus]
MAVAAGKMKVTKFDECSEKDLEFEPEPEPRPNSRCPDGGWGWVIVFASFMCNVIVDGICFTFGQFVQDIISYYDAGHWKATLVGSLLVGCYLLAGPIGGALANRFGCRKVTIFGAILACAGFLISMSAPSIEILVLTYGIIAGAGLGLVYLPAIVIIGYWFERKRAFATGIALCGSGIGTLIFAPLNKYLREEYHWKQCTMLVAGIVLQCVICGALFRPLERPTVKRMKRGVVQRGSIMKALILEKERQRTISNGSLDNCIITKDNRLIKIDKIDLRNKSSSYINRLKEHLGYSSRSLLRSKNSLIIHGTGLPNGSVNGSACSTPQRTGSFNSTPPSLMMPSPETPSDEPKKVSPQKRRKRDYERRLERRDSGCGSLESPKARSYDALPQDDPWEKLSKEGSLNIKSLSSNTLNSQGNVSPTTTNSKSGSFYNVSDSNGNSRSQSNNHLLPPQCILGSSVMTVPPQYSASVQTIENYEERDIPVWIQSLSTMFDLSLLKEKAFVIYAITSFLNMLGFFIPYFFLPEKVRNMPKENSSTPDPESFVLAVIGLSNTLGRVLVGWIADRPWANSVLINNFSLVLAGVITILCPFCTTYSLMILFSCGFGLTTAAFLSLRSIVLVDLIGLERLTSSFGLLILFQGIASILGSPLAGWLMDATNHIDSVFYMSGSLLALAGILGYPLMRMKHRPQDLPLQQEDLEQYGDVSQAQIEYVKLGQKETAM